jgi:ATP-dependent DNA ligase
VHEPKLDGYRTAARIDASKRQLLTRNGIDWTHRYPDVVGAVKELKLKSAYLDTELCGVDANVMPSFALTQQATDGDKNMPLMLYGFDLLHLNGKDTARLPLLERKALLQPLIDGRDGFQPRTSKPMAKSSAPRPARWALRAQSRSTSPMRPTTAGYGSRPNAGQGKSSSLSAGRIQTPAESSVRCCSVTMMMWQQLQR